jgi:NDP-sugar pyrophosphorylase family protein
LPVAILAGGLATRLKPVTEKIPKALIAIAGEPFIAHQLRLLRDHGAARIVLCVGYLGEQIQDVVGDGRAFGLDVRYSFDGPVLLGTGGALKQALPLLGQAFLVLYGDSYLPCDYRGIQAAFQASRRSALMTVYPNEGRWDTSNVECVAGEIVAYDKRNRTPRMRYIDYGLGAFRSDAFESVPNGQPYDLELLYKSLLKAGQLFGREVPERFYEIGSFQGIAELEEHLSSKAVSS